MSETEDAAAARAAEQARIRKERREAKIKAGGSARLNKITGLGGGLQRDPLPSKPEHADPDEVDISVSEHFYTPPRTAAAAARDSPAAADASAALPAGGLTEAQMRQQLMMMGLGGGPDANSPPPPYHGGAPGEEDPMLKLLAQMMGGAAPGGGPFGGVGGGGGGAGGPANPFAAGGGFPGFPGMQPQAQAAAPAPTDAYSAVWRVLHLVVALGLGLYIALLTGFTGTKAARDQAELAVSLGGAGGHEVDAREDEQRHRFFYAFATAEAMLLTSRYFLDRARAPPSGLLWTVAGFLPSPFKSYLETALRYSQIFTTLRSDLLVCVFVLGICSWVRAL